MGKIIIFPKAKEAKKLAPHGYIQFDEIQECMDMLYTQAELLDEISRYAESFLREMSLDPAQFALAKESAQEYMKLNIMDLQAGSEDIYVCFDAYGKDVEYTLEVTVTCPDHNSIEMDGVMFRKSSRGSEVYEPDTKTWCRCPD